VLSPVDGQVRKIHVAEGRTVSEKQLLVELMDPTNSLNGLEFGSEISEGIAKVD
jgi:multidrug efflux pump subunit AcrA (membrane-fusion protein)